MLLVCVNVRIRVVQKPMTPFPVGRRRFIFSVDDDEKEEEVEENYPVGQEI